jgi:long-chain acyl-CoA synthetase
MGFHVHVLAIGDPGRNLAGARCVRPAGSPLRRKEHFQVKRPPAAISAQNTHPRHFRDGFFACTFDFWQYIDSKVSRELTLVKTSIDPGAAFDPCGWFSTRRENTAGRSFGGAMDKIWLKHYPPGMPSEVDLHEYASLREILEKTCARFRELPAVSNMGATLTYSELDAATRDFGAYLQRTLQLPKGERVAIMMPNLLQYPVAMFGALRAGLTVVNCNPLYTARELEHQLKDSGATSIVVLENFAHTLQQVIGGTSIKTVITTQVGDLLPLPRSLLTNLVVKHVKHMVPEWRIDGAIGFKDALAAGRSHDLAPVPLGHDDMAFLQYTGGTTGVAKGAILTHGNMVANLQQASAWISKNLVEGAETTVIPLPLYHILSLTVSMIFIKLGAHLVLITNPRDLPAFVNEIKKVKFTAILGVNTLFNALLNTPGFSDVAGGSLKLAFAGGMAVQQAVAKRWEAVTGAPLIEGYGLTEASPVVTGNPLDIAEWTGTIGLPIPSTEVSIRDDARNELPVGSIGEICVRGPQVMKGYWNRPDETEKAFVDGWLRTGDLGCVDERGYFKITDRKKDMILVSGFNVYPNEVEDVVMMHPGVMEVAAIGVPDEKSGEAVKIVVIRKDPGLTTEDLVAHCRKYLTGYKLPRTVEFRTEPLPKTNIGKVLRRLLRDTKAGQEQTA